MHIYFLCMCSLVQCVYSVAIDFTHICIYAEIRCLAPFPLLPVNRHDLTNEMRTNTELTLFIKDALGTQSYCVTTRNPRLIYDGVFAPSVFTVYYGITPREREVFVSCI